MLEVNQEIVDLKVEYLNQIYEFAISNTKKDFLQIAELPKGKLIQNANYSTLAKIYKELHHIIKYLDRKIKVFHCFTQDYEMLRFQLLTIYNGIYNVLKRDYGISEITVNEETDRWTFIL